MKIKQLYPAVLFSCLLPCSIAINSVNDIKTRTIGAPNSLNFSIYYEFNGSPISTFHDIPLFANENKTLFNMIVEIPRWTNAKNEINKETPLNPIRQDVSDGKPRFVPNVFPFKGYLWNYGAFPQTWEDPNYISPFTGNKGDNDPIDVIEIGTSVATVGQIKQVGILGVIGLQDQGETDWKVIVIDSTDPLFENLNDVDDIETYMPGLLDHTINFFETYKIPSGRQRNSIAFDGVPQDKAFATSIVLETHDHWELLINGTTAASEIQKANLYVNESPFKVDNEDIIVTSVPESNPLPAAEIPGEFDKWYYVETLESVEN